MPLKDVKCNDCKAVWEEILRSEEPSPPCSMCGSANTELVQFYSGGTYFIKGDNSASERPRKSRSTENKKS